MRKQYEGINERLKSVAPFFFFFFLSAASKSSCGLKFCNTFQEAVIVESSILPIASELDFHGRLLKLKQRDYKQQKKKMKDTE